MKPQDSLGLLLLQTATSLARSSDTILLDQLGVGFSQFKILYVLQAEPHIRQKEIALELGQTEASVSRQLKNMYDDGLTQSRQRPDNRREHITTLTKRGERICVQAVEILNHHHNHVFARLSDEQQKRLFLSLRQLQ